MQTTRWQTHENPSVTKNILVFQKQLSFFICPQENLTTTLLFGPLVNMARFIGSKVFLTHENSKKKKKKKKRNEQKLWQLTRLIELKCNRMLINHQFAQDQNTICTKKHPDAFFIWSNLQKCRVQLVRPSTFATKGPCP